MTRLANLPSLTMRMLRWRLGSRAASYLLLCVSQVVLVSIGIVGSGCNPENSPNPTYSVPDPANRATDGGIKASSLGSDAILAPNAKLDSGDEVPIKWTLVSPPKHLVVLPLIKDPETGGTKLTVFKGTAKAPGETLVFIGTWTSKKGVPMQATYNMRVEVQ
jgi:hypothetical protein